jgi:hypothetical protein
MGRRFSQIDAEKYFPKLAFAKILTPHCRASLAMTTNVQQEVPWEEE